MRLVNAGAGAVNVRHRVRTFTANGWHPVARDARIKRLGSDKEFRVERVINAVRESAERQSSLAAKIPAKPLNSSLEALSAKSRTLANRCDSPWRTITLKASAKKFGPKTLGGC